MRLSHYTQRVPKPKEQRIREIYSSYSGQNADADQQLSRQNNDNLSFSVSANNGL